MSKQSEIVELFINQGDNLANDLRESLSDVLRINGRKSPNDPKLNFRPVIKTTPDGDVKLLIMASGEYWKFIESGRRPGARRIPADVVGKVWQNQNNIDPRKVLNAIRQKNGLKISKKTLNFDKAAKSLSFVIQRSIYIKGIKPKPFVSRVTNDGRMQAFKNELKPLLGQSFKLIIKGLE